MKINAEIKNSPVKIVTIELTKDEVDCLCKVFKSAEFSYTVPSFMKDLFVEITNW